MGTYIRYEKLKRSCSVPFKNFKSCLSFTF
jgi:hypothetical protein